MSRQQRQLDELGHLCRSGAVGRAVDLAFEHFADFGRDDDVVVLLADAVADEEVPGDVRQRFADLCVSPR